MEQVTESRVIGCINVNGLPRTDNNFKWWGGYDSKGKFYSGASRVGKWQSSKEKVLQELEEMKKSDLESDVVGVEYGYQDEFPKPGSTEDNITYGYVLVSHNRISLHAQSKSAKK